MLEPYQPKYAWKRTQIDEADPPTDFDWIGYEGEGAVGRVRKEMHGPTKGRWLWGRLVSTNVQRNAAHT